MAVVQTVDIYSAKGFEFLLNYKAKNEAEMQFQQNLKTAMSKVDKFQLCNRHWYDVARDYNEGLALAKKYKVRIMNQHDYFIYLGFRLLRSIKKFGIEEDLAWNLMCNVVIGAGTEVYILSDSEDPKVMYFAGGEVDTLRGVKLRPRVELQKVKVAEFGEVAPRDFNLFLVKDLDAE